MPKAIFEGIYRDLKGKIQEGTYSYQKLLPSEGELTAEYGCSRNTLRRAEEHWLVLVLEAAARRCRSEGRCGLLDLGLSV